MPFSFPKESEEKIERAKYLRSEGYTIKECQAKLKQEFGEGLDSFYYEDMPFEPKRGNWDNMNLYLSFSMEDSERLQIPAIVKILRQHPKVKTLLYREGDAQFPDGTIDDFIKQGIACSDVIIFLCTPNSLRSVHCKKEAEIAVSQDKWIVPVYENIRNVPCSIRSYWGFDLTGRTPESLVRSLTYYIYPPPPEKPSGYIKTKKFRFMRDDIILTAGVEVYKNNIMCSIVFEHIDSNTGTIKFSNIVTYPIIIADEPKPDRPSQDQIEKTFDEFCTQLEINVNADFRDYFYLNDQDGNERRTRLRYYRDLVLNLLQVDNSYFFQWGDAIESKYKGRDPTHTEQMRRALGVFWSIFSDIIWGIDGNSGEIRKYHMNIEDIMPFVIRIADLDSASLFDYTVNWGGDAIRKMLGSYPELFSKYPGYDKLELEDDDGPYDDGFDTSKFKFVQKRDEDKKKIGKK